jgi:hypothetical protein
LVLAGTLTLPNEFGAIYSSPVRPLVFVGAVPDSAPLAVETDKSLTVYAAASASAMLLANAVLN